MRPCEALYVKPNVGLTFSSLPKEVLHMIFTEEDFQAIMDKDFETASNKSDAVDSTVQTEEPVCDSQQIVQY